MKPIIYVATDEDYRSYSRNYPKLSSAIQVISYDNRNQSGINMPDYIDAGNVLIEHPYISGKYIVANNLSIIDDICKAKFFKISEIAGLLGAKEYSIGMSQHKYEERVFNTSVNLDYQIVSINADVQIQNTFCERTNISLHDTFGNGAKKVTKEAYNKAKRKVERYNLSEDEDINSMLALRNPREDNYLSSRTFHFDMTREINKRLDIAFSLSCIPIFSFNGNVRQLLTQRETITIDVRFVFSD